MPTPSTPPKTPQPELPSRSSVADPGPWWLRLARRGLVNLCLCQFVTAMMWLMPGSKGELWHIAVYANCIGMLCWLFIDGGRKLMIAQWPALDPRDTGWPGKAGIVFCVLAGTAAGYALGTLAGDAVTGLSLHKSFRSLQPVLMSLLAAVGATLFFYQRERAARQQAAAEAAQRLASETQLKLLRSQLEPHMLFNTLANLRVLIGLDAERAQAMLDHLIAYLRATLNASRADRHALAAEFERVDDYLALMAIRMGPRLSVQLDLPAELRPLPVPPLLLQPLVENAIQHGLEPHLAGGCIRVSATRIHTPQGPRLCLRVSDNGAGLPASEQPAATAGTGFGTGQVRERLASLFGDAAQFTLGPGADGGTDATVLLPWPAPG
ncbi:sensor histidine kinase [Aquabacterium sp. OR-4]|uniref:sensor histidine kinase n=1 Tax=Aquabacterium sp. OR-4 TaxID=2978127 RepID=UPI0021B449C5|nr:histidine kinase [Aquabacterium sp. OR-4]MDT7835206.1 histidine kinase [Aquabacterium sp. OR-4]